MSTDASPQWPDLPFAAWRDTCETLQLWLQVIGKVRNACTPLINHWRNCTLKVTSRGLIAPAMNYRGRTFDVVFDFAEHQLRIETSDGRAEVLMLEQMTVADFYAAFMQALHRLGIEVHIWTMPVEIEGATPFERDHKHAQYDRVYVQRFWQTLVQLNRVFTEFRSRFIGKASPVHFFWGSFDLAVTRFSGRRAPEIPGADRITREAYSHEVSSVGWWPGDATVKEPAFYSYAAPQPPGFSKAPVRPAAISISDSGEP